MIRSKALRDSAHGQRCTLQIVGVCKWDAATTVLAHFPFLSGGGMALKCDDICAAYACSACHDVMDGRVPGPVREWPPEKYFYAARGMAKTLRRAYELGILTLKK